MSRCEVCNVSDFGSFSLYESSNFGVSPSTIRYSRRSKKELCSDCYFAMERARRAYECLDSTAISRILDVEKEDNDTNRDSAQSPAVPSMSE